MQPAASPSVTASLGRQDSGESKADECVVMYPCGTPKERTGDGALSRRFILIGAAIIILILLIIVIGLAVALGVRHSGCPRCPYKWIGYMEKCYYVSEKEANWTSSRNFCSAHSAFLATIKDEEKVFVNLIKDKRPSWIGLHRQPGHPWKWPNGEKSLVEVIGEGGNCAYLNDEGKPSSSRCSTEHHWICSKAGIV